MSSLLNVKPGISPRFFSQKIEANEPEKNIPSTAAKAMIRSPYVAVVLPIQFRAQSAFFLTQGIVSIALNRYVLQHYPNYLREFVVILGKLTYRSLGSLI